MRWRRTFTDEVLESLHRLGLRGCLVCGSAESLSMSPLPVVLPDAGFDSWAGGVAPGGEHGPDLTFTVRVECDTCGHLMLFNALKYRTGDDKLLQHEPAEEHEQPDRRVAPSAAARVPPARAVPASGGHGDGLSGRAAELRSRSARARAASADLTSTSARLIIYSRYLRRAGRSLNSQRRTQHQRIHHGPVFAGDFRGVADGAARWLDGLRPGVHSALGPDLDIRKVRVRF